MAAPAIDTGTIIRCPVCLAMQSVSARLKPEAGLTCRSCGRTHLREHWLPLRKESAAPMSAPAAKVKPGKPVRWSGTIALCAAGIALTLWPSLRMKGEEFLAYYFLVFLVTF